MAVAEGDVEEGIRSFQSIYGIVSLDRIPRPPQDHHVGETINEFQKYLNDTRVEKTFLALVAALLRKSKLPYNPYASFLEHLYRYAEGKLVQEAPDRELLSLFSMEVRDTRIDYIYKSATSSHIWGLPYVVQCCSPRALKQYDWLSADVVPPTSTTRSADPNYVIQPCVAMVGPAVFHGSFYLHVPVVQFRVEYRITGPDATHAIEVFNNIVIRDLNHTEKESDHILLGVSLPIDPESEPLRYSSKFWQVDEINTRGDAFWDAMVETVTNRKHVVAELVFRIDPKMSIYKRGRKQYTFNFVQRTSVNQEVEALTPFAEMMEACLFEGIFPNQTHAESYIATFCPRDELVDRKKKYRQEPPASYIRKSKLRRGVKVEKEKTDDRIMIDGFLLNGPVDYSPDSKKIVDPVRTAWEKHIARSHFVSQAFEVVHLMILLMLMDRKKYSAQHFAQVHRFQRSTAARMHSLIIQNQFIREIVENFERAEESQIAQRQFMEYRRGVKDLLDSVQRDCSSEMITCGRAIEARLYEMSHSAGGKGSNIILSPKSVLDLRFINHYCYHIFLRLVEMILPEVPLIVEFVEGIKRAHPGEAQAIEFKVQDPGFTYGYEEPFIMKQRRQKIDVDAAIAECSEPREIAQEAVRMQYLIDSRIDEVWSDFIVDVLTSNTFPQNPYPKLITQVRRAALKMNLCYSTNDSIVQQLYHAAPQLLDADSGVYQMPGSDAYGYKSALYAIDTGAYFALSSFLFPLVHEDFVQKRGVYRAAICTCTVGDVSFYGRVDPYLRQVNIADHVYIKGPVRCSREGMELFTVIVIDYVLTLESQQDFLVMGIFIGSMEKRWTVEEISERRTTFVTELENALAQKEDVFLRLYARYEWRYISVTKYFRYRYVSFDETEYVAYFNENPTEPYQSVFFDQEKAAFHFKRGGAHLCCDPFIGPAVDASMNFADDQILAAQRRQDFFSVHRWLLLKSLAANERIHVAESWRMLHSPAAELNFLNCVNKALQDLIFYALANKQFPQTKEEERGPSLYDFGIDESLFASTLAGYYHKLMDVLRDRIALAPRSLADYLRLKLNMITERSVDGNLIVKVESQSIRALEEIRQTVMGLENSIAADLHECCPEAKEGVAAVVVKREHARPKASEAAASEVRIEAPKATVADHLNEWHRDFHLFD